MRRNFGSILLNLISMAITVVIGLSIMNLVPLETMALVVILAVVKGRIENLDGRLSK